MGNSAERQNNFDFLRFLAATMVLFGHCCVLFVYPFAITNASLHVWGVNIFFAISGYLITASYERHRNLPAFLRNRFLRIYPGLFVALVSGALCLGPLITSLSLHDYFFSSDVWRPLYLWLLLMPDAHGLLAYIPLPVNYGQQLPGIFPDGVHAISGINGPIWTIPMEVHCYIAIALLGASGRLNAVFLLVLAGLYAVLEGMIPESDATYRMLAMYGVYFFLGALLYCMRRHFPLSKQGIVLSLVFWLAYIFGYCPAVTGLLAPFAFTYMMVGFGFAEFPIIRNFGKYGDFSYGMYLYAWPIQRLCLAPMRTHGNFFLYLVVCFSLALLCAILSWHWIEKPFLSLKNDAS